MSDDFDSIDIVGEEDVPVTESVKVNGPPGTGKTTQGIARILKLIRAHDIRVWDIAWATYRRSLAEEVLDRLVDVDILSRDELEDPWNGRTEYFSTIHAIARRIAEREALRTRDVVRWQDKQDFMLTTYSVPFQSHSNDTPDYGSLLFDVYYWLVNNNIPMSAAHECPLYQTLATSWSSHPTVEQFAHEWESYKQTNDLVDFHEYLTHVVEENIAPPVSVLVIDEYHDAYPLMHEVGKLWIEAADTAIVLGDPQQVINLHEGASPEFFEALSLPEVQLEKTWRVPPVLWEAATDVLAGWHDPHEPEFNDEIEGDCYEIRPPQIDYNNDMDVWQSPTEEYGTPDDLVERFDGQSTLFLARTQRMVEGITQAWLEAGILFRSQVGNGWRTSFRRRHLYNALQRIRGLELEMVKWHRFATRWADHAEECDRDTDAEPPVSMHSREASNLIRHTPAKYLKHSREEADNRAYWFEEATSTVEIGELGLFFTDEFWTEMTRGAESAAQLVNREGESAIESEYIINALERNDAPTLPLADCSEVGTSNDDAIYDDGLDDAPVAKTIHASKGSEADIAVVYDGITQSIRDSIRQDLRSEANEDRVWYVGLSRAKDAVVVARDVWWWADDYLPFTMANHTTDAALPEK